MAQPKNQTIVSNVIADQSNSDVVAAADNGGTGGVFDARN